MNLNSILQVTPEMATRLKTSGLEEHTNLKMRYLGEMELKKLGQCMVWRSIPYNSITYAEKTDNGQFYYEVTLGPRGGIKTKKVKKLTFTKRRSKS